VTATATDTIGQTTSDTNNVTVDNVADPTIHSGDLDSSAVGAARGGKWTATVTITIHDDGEVAVANATVDGSWSNGANGSGSCLTDSVGECVITRDRIKRNSASVTFTVDTVAHATLTYSPSANHDPDGDSNGTLIIVAHP
jgi:hypothetical protein